MTYSVHGSIKHFPLFMMNQDRACHAFGGPAGVAANRGQRHPHPIPAFSRQCAAGRTTGTLLHGDARPI